jgi:hypothetical protein
MISHKRHYDISQKPIGLGVSAYAALKCGRRVNVYYHINKFLIPFHQPKNETGRSKNCEADF